MRDFEAYDPVFYFRKFLVVGFNRRVFDCPALADRENTG